MSALKAIHIGYSWNIPLAEKYSLQTELFYNVKGSEAISKETEPNNYGENYNNYNRDNFTCFSLPITLNYMFTPHFFVELGGEYSLGQSTYSVSNGIIHEFSIDAGIGYSTKYVDLSLRYIHGITPLKQQTQGTYPVSYDVNGTPVPESYTRLQYTNRYRTFQISLTIPVFKYITKRK